MAWGWRLPRRRACRYRWAAHGEGWRLLSAKMPRALRARVLAAQRNWTTAALPDCLVTGVAPTSAAAWERSLARSRIGPTSARTWARLIWPMRGSGWRTVVLGCLPRAAARARSSSARLPSRLRSSRTWMRMGVAPGPGDRAGRLRPGRPAAGEAARLGCAGRCSRGGAGRRRGGPRPAAGRPAEWDSAPGSPARCRCPGGQRWPWRLARGPLAGR
jgi:hypothetical protein